MLWRNKYKGIRLEVTGVRRQFAVDTSYPKSKNKTRKDLGINYGYKQVAAPGFYPEDHLG